jgi:hypothetical protein
MFIANQILRIFELRRSDMLDFSRKGALSSRKKHFTPTEFLEPWAVRSINISLLTEFKVRPVCKFFYTTQSVDQDGFQNRTNCGFG